MNTNKHIQELSDADIQKLKADAQCAVDSGATHGWSAHTILALLAKIESIATRHPAPESSQQAGGVTVKAWDFCPECGSEEIHHEESNHKQCAVCHQEWWTDVDYTEVVRKYLSERKTTPHPADAAPEDAKPVEILSGPLAAVRSAAPFATNDQLRDLLPNDCYYMDPPDGGNVTVLEQLQRMAVDAANWRLAATPGLRHGAEISFNYGGIKIDDGCFICFEHSAADHDPRASQPEVPYPRMRVMFAGSSFQRFELLDVTDLKVIK